MWAPTPRRRRGGGRRGLYSARLLARGISHRTKPGKGSDGIRIDELDADVSKIIGEPAVRACVMRVVSRPRYSPDPATGITRS